jgi:hypothetical protein
VVRNGTGRTGWRWLTIFVSQYKHQLVSMREEEEEGEEGGRVVVVVAVAGVEGGEAGGGWVLYKEERTPNSQYQWDFLRRISDPLDHPHQNNISIKKFSALGIASVPFHSGIIQASKNNR